MSTKDKKESPALKSEDALSSDDGWLQIAAKAPWRPFAASPAEADTLATNEAPKEGAPGATLPEKERYQSQGEVARGGIGRILRAHDQKLDRPVALKELLRREANVEERFLREALLTAKLEHPSIVPVHDVGLNQRGSPYYAMKLVDGRSFDKVIEEKKSVEERLSLLPHVLDASQALAYAHSKRIIHRDLKPHNILIGPFGETVVVDWGLAKELAPKASEALAGRPTSSQGAALEEGRGGDVPYRKNEETNLTQEGSILGTPAYMPPEQATGQAVDERADVYSLGAILYHLFAGEPPYRGKSSKEILTKLLHEPPISLEERQPGVPKDLLAIVKKAMARRVEERYPSAKELSQDLKSFQTGQLVGAYQYSGSELVRRWIRKNWVFMFAGMALLATLFVVSVNLYRTERSLSEAQKREGEARAAKQEADKEREIAQAREKKAKAHADEVAFEQARLLAHQNPLKAIELLSNLSEDFPKMGAVRTIAADALSQKRAKVFRGGGDPFSAGIVIPDEKQILALEDNGTIWRFPIDGASAPSNFTISNFDPPPIFSRFSLNGRFLAFVDRRGTAQLVELNTQESRALGPQNQKAAVLCFSPDSSLLVIGYDSGEVRLVELSTNRSLVLGGHTSFVFPLVLSSGGSWLVTTSRETAQLWDLSKGAFSFEEGRPPRSITFQSPGSYYEVMALSPDGSKLIGVGILDQKIDIWKISSDRSSVSLEQSVQNTSDVISQLGFSPDMRFFYTLDETGVIQLWSLSTNPAQQKWAVTLEEGREAGWAGFSPKGDFWYSSSGYLGGSPTSTFTRLDLETGERDSITGHQGLIREVNFFKDGSTFVSFGEDSTARLWSLEGSRPKYFKSKPSTRIRQLPIAISSKGELAFCTTEGVALSNATTNKERILSTQRGCVSVAFSVDGKLLAVAEEGIIEVFDAADLTRPIKTLTGPPLLIYQLKFSPDSKWLSALPGDKDLWLWNVESGEGQELKGHTNKVRSIAFSPDSQSLASGSWDNTGRLWALSTSVPTEGRVLPWDGGGRVLTTAFSSDGRFLALGGGGPAGVKLFDLQTNQTTWVKTPEILRNVPMVIFSPDSSLLAMCGERVIYLWDTKTQKRRLLGKSSPQVVSLAFSPDGKTLASVGTDATVRLWDIETGESRILLEHKTAVLQALFFPDSKMIASLDADGFLYLWEDNLPQAPKELLSALQQKAKELQQER